ncbi:MAG: hypothetical protein Q4C95_00535 [Planctomycetia bacterium]|nr:hypothetical protein [Planctomycetia bacterium]
MDALNGMPASSAGFPGQPVRFGKTPTQDTKASDQNSDIQFLIPPQYGNRNTTDLTIEITSSTRETNFIVERPEE